MIERRRKQKTFEHSHQPMFFLTVISTIVYKQGDDLIK